MGETFKKIAEWVKTHKWLAIALSGGTLLLIYLYFSSQSQAQANAAAASAAQAASGQPSDAILSQEIQAQAALQQTQIAAQAQTAHDTAQSQLSMATLQAQEYASWQQTQAALTLGLAQAGDSTSSILQLLGAQPQPGGVPTTPTIAPGDLHNTNPGVYFPPQGGATITGATATGGTGTNAQQNPATLYPLPVATTPVDAAASRPQPAAGMTDYYGLLSEAGLQNCSPLDTACVANNSAKQAAVEDYWAAHQSEGVPANTPVNIPSLSSAQVQGPTGFFDPSYQGGNVVPDLSSYIGTSAVVSPSVVSGSGGTPYNPPGRDVISPHGRVGAGGVVSAMASASQTDWSSILAAHGIQDGASVQTGMAVMLGANHPMPDTTSGVSGVS